MKLFGKIFDENDLFIAFFNASHFPFTKEDDDELAILDAIKTMAKAVYALNLMPEKIRQRILDIANSMADMPSPEYVIRYRGRVEKCESKDKHQS